MRKKSVQETKFMSAISFTTFPDDILAHLKVFLTTSDISCLRRVIRLQWHGSDVFSFGYNSLKNKILSIRQAPRIKAICAQCGCVAMTDVQWKCGMFRGFLPWCRMHVDRTILKEVDVYCLGIEHFL